MPLLTREPSIDIASVERLMAIARAMEQEAERRYGEMAQRMRLLGEDELAALFTFLARIEGKHAAHVAERSIELIGRVPDPAAVRWELPERFEDEEGHSYLLTPYKALAIAVRNEDRAFAFYSYLAAHAANAAIRRHAEELAKEELDHAALLRRERRKAWRRESRQVPPKTPDPANLGQLLARVAAIEEFTAKAHRVLSARLAGEGREREAGLFDEAAKDEELVAREAAEGAEGPVPAFGRSSSQTVRDGLRLLEYAFNQYTEIADHARDETVLNEAQRFASHALKRLSYVSGSLGNTLIDTARSPAAGSPSDSESIGPA